MLCSRATPLVSMLACLAAVAVLASVPAASAACTSGVLQLNPQPQGDDFRSCLNPDIDQNSVKAACGAAYRVTVENNIVRMVPLETRSFNVSIVGPGPGFVFNCKDLNASGLFYGGSTSSASVMLYDNLKGPQSSGRLSNLTKTGASEVSLTLGQTYAYRSPFGPPTCTYKYTVVSGCVLDARPPSPAPKDCPPGNVPRTGRFNLQYCVPCPRGTYSRGGPGATCIPCPVGTSSSFAAGQARCIPCTGENQYGPTVGALSCGFCDTRNNWTDRRTKCEACPAGSKPSQSKVSQCVRCYAGKKCCTVNWDKDCPKCTSAATPKSYTSIFALESATPASCLDTDFAMCSPKINVTLDGVCQVVVNSVGYSRVASMGNFCQWRSSTPIRGPAVNPLVDLAKIGDLFTSYNAKLGVNVTGAASPYLDITVPSAKCTLRYRALTKPAAAILGAAPKPAPKATCPAGKYIDTSTDTKPGPCLPCPRGTYSTKAGTTGACTPCPAGTFSKYGSRSCTKCLPGSFSAKGASQCSFCDRSDFYSKPNRLSCSACPRNTYNQYTGTSTCLGRVAGVTCCAAGDCGTQPRCKGAPSSGSEVYYHAVFKLVSRSLSGKACKSAGFLSCLRPGSRISVESASNGLSLVIKSTVLGDTCATNASQTLGTYSGYAAATNRAVVYGNADAPAAFEAQYEIITNGAARTFTVYLSKVKGSLFTEPTLVPPVPSFRKECSATFALEAGGYFLDIKPKAGPCPAAASTANANGLTLCQFCGVGSVKDKKTGKCKQCPANTYQVQYDGIACKPCPAGYSCSPSSLPDATPCNFGLFGTKAGQGCKTCPAGTFSGAGVNKACIKCPKGTLAPAGSSGCGVPWVTKF